MMSFKSKKLDNWVLCFVEDLSINVFALYFVKLGKRKLKDIRGDDWDDIPYEHNASPPNEITYKIIVEDSNLNSPASFYINSPYSVEDINGKLVPWLKGSGGKKEITIWAGDTLSKVIKNLIRFGSKIYIEI